ncbi:predicted protein [Naegleria gruberi]|uniref:Predicted protein n=1 Tax=Naegleria gruberi TaxID=5762 RepID=D2V0K2_NAEGR|nr:uncharacterized protein NAEGRDRAFT_62323 [Naegleria gruberi]EFC49537.1 predicted protein [Naegleria gruberi]|eukprot:XP_002682281.1 predicted protein [Naegleria gruberi strain NEG-M]
MLSKFKNCLNISSSSRNKFIQSSLCKLNNTTNNITNNNNIYRSFTITNSTFSSSSDNNSSSSSFTSQQQLEQLNNNNSSPSSNNNNSNNSSNNNNSSSNHTFSLEDLDKVKEELIKNLLEIDSNSSVPLPSPGKSSGDQSIDEATKQWRLTNTKDDENLQKLFKSTKQKASTSLLEQSQLNSNINDMENDDFEVGVDKDEFSKYVNPFNPETQEVNGPKRC